MFLSQIRIWIAHLTVFAAVAASGATFTVTNTDDSGPGSLRAACGQANLLPGDHVIVFALPAGSGRVILPTIQIAIYGNVTILNDRPGDLPVTIRAERTSNLLFECFTIFGRVVLSGLNIVAAPPHPTWGESRGGIFVQDGTLTVRNCTLTDNDKAIMSTRGVITVERSVFSRNRSTDSGAGISASGGELTMSDCELTENVARHGGAAIALTGTEARVSRCLFRGNQANDGNGTTGQGGAFLGGGKRRQTLIDCTFIDNVASGYQPEGGAIYTHAWDDTQNLKILNCAFVNNRATVGGAIYDGGSYEGGVEISNCTFSGNSADTGAGGAIYTENLYYRRGGVMRIANCTFSGNVTPPYYNVFYPGAALACQRGGTVRVANSIFQRGNAADNIGDSPGGFYPAAVVYSDGHNISDDAAGGGSGTLPAGLLNAAGDRRNTNPGLGPLASNGGPTQTHALLTGSPAINAGGNSFAPITDQRGYSRTGVSDIGAFEFNGVPPHADFTSDSRSDIIWQNNSSGQRAIWIMSGTQRVGDRFLPTAPTQWQIATSADFNGDGQADIVWQNTATGQRAIWLMNGTSFLGSVFLPTISTEWQIVGSGDFSGDGKPDLVWQNAATGKRAIWLMDGINRVGERFLPTIATDWQIAGVDEFNEDGQIDILLQNIGTGQRAVWLMNGTTYVSGRFLPTVATPWRIAGTGEFNGDGQADIIWQNTVTGQRAIWLMNGTAFAGAVFLPTIPLEWQIRNH